MTQIKLKQKYIIKGHIIAKSGLHIGGTDAGLSIGSPDSTVIKHPITQEPYIPGSSLKGKMRSLTELARGEIGETKMPIVKNGPSTNTEHRSAKIFGTANADESQRPSRIIVRDAHLSKQGNELFDNNPYTEIKTEVVIDRITSQAMPRQLERVPAGARFDLHIVLNVFDGEEDYVEDIFGALELVQDDYIGGSGTRGSGEVSFEISSVEVRTASYYTGNDKENGKSDKTAAYKADFDNLFK